MTTTANNTYVYVGAETSGLYRLSPGSSQWEELTNGLPAKPIVPGVTIHPDNPEIVYAGTQDGPYRSTDRGAARLPCVGSSGMDIHVPARRP